MSTEGAEWHQLLPGRWRLSVRGGQALAIIRRREAGHWSVAVGEVVALCDRPGMDAAMQMAGEALASMPEENDIDP